MNKMKSGWFSVDIIEPTEDIVNSYYENTGTMKSSGQSEKNPRVFKKATILKTFDQENYPVNSTWMMGEAPGILINFFGEKIVLIQEKDLYERID